MPVRWKQRNWEHSELYPFIFGIKLSKQDINPITAISITFITEFEVYKQWLIANKNFSARTFFLPRHFHLQL